MNDEQLLRYGRQILLPGIGYEGQERLLNSRALIIGMGGLGSPVAMYLAAAGIGHLTLVDFDEVELSNLQRQIIHNTGDLGRAKVDSAKDTLQALNPEIQITTLNQRLEGEQLAKQVGMADVVLDCSDNFATRFTLSQACVEAGVPLVSGAAISMEGQVTVFHNEQQDSPCYHCLYHDEGEQTETCSTTGVLAPLVGIIGSVQVTEAIKVLLGMDKTLGGRLLVIDVMTMEWRTIKLRKDPSCPVCSKNKLIANSASI
jgi:adenylyltransferase/sulfurtransferase